MEIFALNSKFELVTVEVPYINLQWKRCYYECGQFQMQVSANVYDASWAYIVTTERPEVGLVQKIQYDDNDGETVLVSGFFAEAKLQRVCMFPRFTSNSTTTEAACKKMFDTCKVQSKKGIVWQANDTLLGDYTESDFIGDNLMQKWYTILETRECSFRVRANNDFTGLTCNIWKGVDRTQSQDEVPWAMFGSSWGNIGKVQVSIDDSSFANVCMVTASDETIQFEVDQSNGGERYEVVLDKGSSKQSEDQTAAQFKESLKQEAISKLADYVQVINIDADNIAASGYLTDYDLGDKVSCTLDKLGLDFETRIVEIDEVFKPTEHSVSLGFGTKRITNIRRAIIT